MGEKLRKILMGIIIIVTSYLLVANILHVMAINKKHDIFIANPSESENVKVLKNDYNKLEDNIEKLRMIKKTNHLDETKYQKILSSLEENYKAINDSGILSFDFNKKYKDKELYDLLVKYNFFGMLNIIESFQTIIDNDPNSGFERERIISEVLTPTLNMSNVQNRVMNNYHYHTITDYAFEVYGVEEATIYVNAARKINVLATLSDYLVKDGGLSE